MKPLFNKCLLINGLSWKKLNWFKNLLLLGLQNTTRPQMERKLEPWSKHTGSGLTSLYLELWGRNESWNYSDFISIMCVFFALTIAGGFFFIPQAGKFGIIPTIVNLGAALSFLSLVSVESCTWNMIFKKCIFPQKSNDTHKWSVFYRFQWFLTGLCWHAWRKEIFTANIKSHIWVRTLSLNQ